MIKIKLIKYAMDLKIRRIYLIFFIVIFVVLAPLVVLYTEGYRYDFEKKRVFKTGVLVLESEPKGAEVYLNGKKQKKKTPAVISNLIPKEYQIEVKKEGYLTWEKKLTIEPEKSTLAQKIRLFKTPLNKELIQKKVVFFKFSPKEDYLFAQSNERVKIYDLKNGKTINLDQTTFGEINDIEWNKSEKKIIIDERINNQRNFLVADIDNSKETTSIKSIIKLIPQKVNWDPQNEERFIYKSQNKLYRVNLKSKKIEPIITEEVSDFIVSQNSIVYLKNIEKGPLKIYQFATEQTKLITELDNNSVKFIKGNDDIITLINSKGKKLYFIHPEMEDSLKIEEIDSQVKDALWTKDARKLIYWKDFEIWILDLDENKKEFITRLGSAIDSVLYFPDDSYLIYSTKEETKILELDSRNTRNSIDLLSGEINLLYLDTKGENLFYLQKQNLNKTNFL